MGELYRVRKKEPTIRQLSEISSSNDATEIFFLGVGHAYHGIMHLLNNRGKRTFMVGKFTTERLFMAELIGHLHRHRPSPDLWDYKFCCT